MSSNYNRVTHREIGDIPGIIPPVHVPSLLEQAGVIRCDKNGKVIERHRNADEWCRLIRDYLDNRGFYKWDQISKMATEYIPV